MLEMSQQAAAIVVSQCVGRLRQSSTVASGRRGASLKQLHTGASSSRTGCVWQGTAGQAQLPPDGSSASCGKFCWRPWSNAMSAAPVAPPAAPPRTARLMQRTRPTQAGWLRYSPYSEEA
jgi:hypothetical protein